MDIESHQEVRKLRLRLKKTAIVLALCLSAGGLIPDVCLAAPPATWSDAKQSALTALQDGKLSESEQVLRDALSNPEWQADKTRNAENQRILAMVLSARGFETDKQTRMSRFSGSDILACLVVLALAGTIIYFLIKHGPQRPKFVDDTTRWMEKVRQETADDAVRQFNSILWSMLIFALCGGGILVFIFGVMHLVAYMDRNQLENKQSEPFYKEAQSLLQSAYRNEEKEPQTREFEALGIYADYLDDSGREAEARAVQQWQRVLESHNRARCERPVE